MKKLLKRISLFVLCFAIALGAVSVGAPLEKAEARTIAEVEKELTEYKSMLTRLQNELKTISSDISSLENQSGQTTKLMAQYQAEIDVLESEIAINEAIMESFDMKRAEVITQIAGVEEDYDYRVSMYKKLMQFIYENSETSAFELLFSSENISDYLTKRDNFNDIMKAANELIKDIKVTLADLDALNAELAETQAKYDEHLTELNKSKLELETKVTKFETIAAELNLNAQELSEKYKDKNATVKEIKNKITSLEAERKKLYESSAAFIWPLSKSASYRVTSQFGWRGDPFGGSGSEFHKGIDIACSRGTPIVAVKSGVVTQASNKNNGYGECVIIYHGNGISTIYAHCDNTSKTKPKYEVKVGDSVKAGQVIAYVGTTGRSTGYHLHFGVIDTNSYNKNSGNYVNPNKYLPDGYYTKKS